MKFTGERYFPEVQGALQLEHIHRYLIACTLAQGKTVLDIASGEGYGSAMLSNTAQKVIGVDISKEAVKYASQKYSLPNLSYRQGDATQIPIENHSVDMVTSFETIEHHDHHVEMLKEIRRVLRPGGLLLMSSPDKNEYSGQAGVRNEFHVKELTGDEFKNLLKSHFKHCSFTAQRVLYASVIGSLDPKAQFVSWDIHNSQQISRGLANPMFHIVLASDAEIPIPTTGILEDKFSYKKLCDDIDHLLAVRENQKKALAATREILEGTSYSLKKLQDQIEKEHIEQQKEKEEIENLPFIKKQMYIISRFGLRHWLSQYKIKHKNKAKRLY